MEKLNVINGGKWIVEGNITINDAEIAYAVSFIYTYPEPLDVQQGLHHPHHDIDLCREEICTVYYENGDMEIKEPSYYLADGTIKDLIYEAGIENWKPYRTHKKLVSK